MTDEKILKDEILSEEELEKVAGGSHEELVKDQQFMRNLGFSLLFDKGDELSVNGVVRAWAKCGIAIVEQDTVSNDPNANSNEYFYKGKQIPRQQALNIAMKKAGKKMDLRTGVHKVKMAYFLHFVSKFQNIRC